MISQREKNERAHWNKLSKQYDSIYGYKEPFTRYKIEKKTRIFVEYLKKYGKYNGKQKMLEVGCGTGEYTKIISGLLPKASITALDISENIIKCARQKCKGCKNIIFVANSILESKIKANSFDVIYGFYVLHHLNFEEAFKEIGRILKPGGIAYFCEPNILNPIVYVIKSNKYLKKRVGDTDDEWAINPITVGKNNKYVKEVDIRMSEYVPSSSLFGNKLSIEIDKYLENITRIPLLKYLGGTVHVVFINK